MKLKTLMIIIMLLFHWW